MRTKYSLESLEKNRTLIRPTCRWEDNIKMDPKETGWGGVDWTDVAQDRVQQGATLNIMNLWIGKVGREFLE
jgi:hypothetical protein